MAHDKSSAKLQIDAACGTLRAHSHRVTEPRKALLGFLAREHGPFTAEELHARMKPGLCDLVTVYRSLAAMEKLALVRRCDFGDGSYRYEFNTGEHHHHHVICQVCREAATLDMCVADGLERIARQMGYVNVTHMLEIFGICPKCQKAGKPHPTKAAAGKS